MMKQALQRGFTLIELLVVIAIIGILASVVLASLNDARDSGADASAKTSMNNVRAQAEIFYNQHGYSYNDGTVNVCTNDTKVAALLVAAATQTGNQAHCQSPTATAYAADVTLRDGTIFCVDSTGYAGLATQLIGADDFCTIP